MYVATELLCFVHNGVLDFQVGDTCPQTTTVSSEMEAPLRLAGGRPSGRKLRRGLYCTDWTRTRGPTEGGICRMQ